VTLAVSELFYSPQGEGARAGEMSVFVRLQGCSAKHACAASGVVCDTEFESGKVWTLEALLAVIQAPPEAVAAPQWIVWCYDDQTEVLTRNGWRFFAELTPFTEVMQVDPLTMRGTWVVPREHFAKPYVGPMVEFSHRNVDLLVTPDHRMLCRPRDGDKRVSIEAANWPERGYLPKSFEWDGVVLNETFGMTPVVWAEFLGFWMAEGSARQRRPGDAESSFVVSLTQRETEYVEALVARTGREWKSYPTESGCTEWRCFDKALTRYLVRFGHALEKFVPREIKDAPPEILRAFLQGFEEGDGGRFGDDSWCYYTGSKQLADDLHEMALKAGWDAQVSVRQPYERFSERPSYVVYVTDRKEVMVWNQKGLKCHVTPVPYDGMVYCVKVFTGFIVVRRHGKSCIAGNTGGEPLDQLTPEMVEWFAQRGFRQALETSGVRPFPKAFRQLFDWIACSPKVAEHILQRHFGEPGIRLYHPLTGYTEVAAHVHELRYVRHVGQELPNPSLTAYTYYLSPHADGLEINRANVAHAIRLCKGDPRWRISVQSHKLWTVL
jgi:organic radical activating enzyme